MKTGRQTYSLLSIVLIGLVLLFVNLKNQKWKNHDAIISDAAGYYSYLPAAFIYRDLSFKFYSELKPTYGNKIEWLTVTPEGSVIQKYPIGTALSYIPLFTIGHLAADLSRYPADGYSMPYQVALQFNGLLYCLLGLLVLRKLLLHSFNDKTTALTLLCIALGTNLFYYSAIDASLSHPVSFFLFALFLLFTNNWLDSGTIKQGALLALIAALIVLVRPNNALVLLFPLLYGIFSLSSLKSRFNWLYRQKSQLLIMLGIGFLVLLPQLLYWKTATNQWVYYSYVGENFFFNAPHIVEGLFGYRKGWFLYTPMALFAVVGISFMKDKLKKWRLPLIIFLLVNIYVAFSWWCWWYGGGFGARIMVESYSILALPLAAFLDWAYKSSFLKKIAASILVALLILLNFFQTYQKTHDLIHYSGMTEKSYWMVFGKLNPPKGYWDAIALPDNENAKLGLPERLKLKVTDSVLIALKKIDFNSFDGQVFVQNPYSINTIVPSQDLIGNHADVIQLRITGQMRAKGPNHSAHLIAQFQKENDVPISYSAESFNSGTRTDWQKVVLKMNINYELNNEHFLNVFVGNSGTDVVLIRQVKVELLQLTKYY